MILGGFQRVSESFRGLSESFRTKKLRPEVSKLCDMWADFDFVVSNVDVSFVGNFLSFVVGVLYMCFW